LTLLFGSVAMLFAQFVTSDRGTTVFGPPLGADFAGFYNAGRILNLRGAEAERLYDWDFQNTRYHELLPTLDPGIVNPFVHPPLVALLFRPLALLPYEVAFAVWLAISLGLYVAGFLLVYRALPNLPRAWRTDGLLVAIAFEPFLMETWLGGQFAAVAFFFLAAAFAAEAAGRPYRSGVLLGVLLYKPTMLVLFLPLLVVGRRWQTLAGAATAGAAMGGLSLLLVGEPICRDYVRVVLNFTGTTTGGGLVRKEWKWVDLNFFLRLLLGGPSTLQSALLLLLSLPPLAFLCRAWWRYASAEQGYRSLLWATTVTWTLVVNLYIGMYDTILVAIAALVTAGVLSGTGSVLPERFRGMVLVLFATPWVAQPIAILTQRATGGASGLQCYTLVLAAFGIYQLMLSEQRFAKAES